MLVWCEVCQFPGWFVKIVTSWLQLSKVSKMKTETYFKSPTLELVYYEANVKYTFGLATMLINGPMQNVTVVFIKRIGVEVTPSESPSSVFSNNVLDFTKYKLVGDGCLSV